MTDPRLTPEEKQAIASLKRLAKTWPKSLWLFAGDGGLSVMRYENGKYRAVLPGGGMNPAYLVERISSIDAEGGDW